MKPPYDIIIVSTKITVARQIINMDTEDTNTILDKNGALYRLGGDAELFVEIVKAFLSDTPKQLKIFSENLHRNERTELKRTAHSLKSAAAAVGGIEMSQLAARLEGLVLEISTEEIQGEFLRLVQSFRQLQAELEGCIP